MTVFGIAQIGDEMTAKQPTGNSFPQWKLETACWQLARTCWISTGSSSNCIVPLFLSLCTCHRCTYSAWWRVFNWKPGYVSCNEAMMRRHVGTRIHIKPSLYVHCNDVYCWISISEWHKLCYICSTLIPACFISVLYLSSSESHSLLHHHHHSSWKPS